MPTSTPLGYPRAHRPLLPALGRLALKLSRWRIIGALPELPKYVIVVAPHTSNWDFPIGVAALFALDLEAHWFGKDSLFRPPMGAVLRMLGGRPVHRETPEGVVAEMAAMIRDESQFVLALAPEGTRKRVDHWRSGFYRIAEAADVPIVAVSFDWSRREIGIIAPVRVSGDLTSDVAILQANYRPEMARNLKGFWAPPK
ncbi:MAG: lysophospholipid acyltransferase family protein [bacterium]